MQRSLESLAVLECLELPGSRRRPLRMRRCGSRLSTGGALASAALMSVVLGAGPARASSPFGILARPQRVIFEPGPPETAERVQIQGLIAFPPPVSSPTADFAAPTCGYMYFKCATGEEDLCREQWQDIAAASAADKCVMFSARRDSTGALIDQGRVRPFSEAATAPGTFIASQGLGVSTIPCSGDLIAACQIPASGSGGAGGGAGGGRSGGAGGAAAGGAGGATAGGGGGAPETAGHGGAAGGAGTGGASSSGGAAGTTGVAGMGGAHVSSSGGAGGGPAGGVSGGSSGTGGMPPGPDAGTGATPGGKGGGCSVTGETGAAAGLLGLVTAGLLAFTSRARRRQDLGRGAGRGREP